MKAADKSTVQATGALRVRKKPRGSTRLSVLRNQLIAVTTILVLWEAAAGGFGGRFQILDPIIVATPSAAAADLVAYAKSGLLLRDLESTFFAAFYGLMIGFISGAVAGIAFGYWKGVAETFEPVVVALNSLPRVAVAPLILMWLGLGLLSKVVVSAFSVFFVVFFNAFLGTRAIDPDLVRAAHSMGASKLQVTKMVVVPAVASWIFAAMRTCISYALTSTITAEFVGSTAGLGYRLQVAAGLLDTKRVFAILFVLMALGGLLVEINKWVESRVLRWRPKSQLQG